MTHANADQATRHRSPRRAGRVAQALVALAAALAVTAISPSATAQTNRLDRDVIESVSITPGSAQATAIQEYAAARTNSLLNASTEDAQSAIDALLNPLDNPETSVAFRQRYAESVLPAIEAMLDDQTAAWHRLTALRIAGRLATEDSVKLINSHLDSDDEPVRFFSIFAVELVFDAASRSQPAVTQSTLRKLVDKLADDLATDPDPIRAAARTRALEKAGSIPNDNASGVANQSLVKLADAMGSRIREMATQRTPNNDRDARTSLAVATVLRTAIVDPNATPSQTLLRAGAGFAGDMTVHVLRRVQAGFVNQAKADSLDAQFITLAAQVATFADEKLAGNGQTRLPTEVARLDESLKKGDIRAFRNGAETMIQTLTEQPFGLSPKRFEH